MPPNCEQPTTETEALRRVKALIHRYLALDAQSAIEQPVPGASLYPDSTRPTPSQPGDGRHWQTGTCWLWCRRNDIDVIWLGPVTSSGMHAPLHACADCIAELDSMVWAWTTSHDLPIRSGYRGARGRHRRRRTRA